MAGPFCDRCVNRGLSLWRGSPQGSPHACVPNVCQLRKSQIQSPMHNRRGNLHNLLIQETLNVRNPPRATSAIIGKNGFVISRSPVRSRRVAPETSSKQKVCLKSSTPKSPIWASTVPKLCQNLLTRPLLCQNPFCRLLCGSASREPRASSAASSVSTS
jgi:hypothetical protein